jgi:5,10-methylene-tetrahydrofolate dehydrogenase/methenyl tetrahydrofolate cyclohydrolase
VHITDHSKRLDPIAYDRTSPLHQFIILVFYLISSANMGSTFQHSGRLRGKVALITGGSRGIGKGIAMELAREGASIAINYCRNAAAAEETVKEIEELGVGALAVKADVTSVAEIAQMFEDAAKHFGRIDIV